MPDAVNALAERMSLAELRQHKAEIEQDLQVLQQQPDKNGAAIKDHQKALKTIKAAISLKELGY